MDCPTGQLNCCIGFCMLTLKCILYAGSTSHGSSASTSPRTPEGAGAVDVPTPETDFHNFSFRCLWLLCKSAVVVLVLLWVVIISVCHASESASATHQSHKPNASYLPATAGTRGR